EKYRAENVQLVPGGNGLSLELGHAYDLPEGSAILRTAELNKDGKITVADQWNLTMPGKPGPHAMELNYLLSGTATLAPGRLHLLPPGAPAVVLTWEPGPLADLETWQLEDPLLEQSWGSTLSRLTLRFPVEARERQQGKLTMTISVEEES
ncbi:MAG: hypothetical protein HIU81_04460, partial [Acidobacteria bacterium]|nr:hypothetical protein [Acidobacteriota bacterium]